MPKSKTINIDEIVTPGKPPGDEKSARSRTSAESPSSAEMPSGKHSGSPSGNPFADFQKALPWKARLTLKATQWFMILRSKSWGKLVIIPAVILALLLVLPLGLIFFCLLVIRSFIRSFSR